MPRFDGTGPLGEGPMTGRGFGYCGTGTGIRRGFWGLGRGFRGRGMVAGFRRGGRFLGRLFGRGFGFRRRY